MPLTIASSEIMPQVAVTDESTISRRPSAIPIAAIGEKRDLDQGRHVEPGQRRQGDAEEGVVPATYSSPRLTAAIAYAVRILPRRQARGDSGVARSCRVKPTGGYVAIRRGGHQLHHCRRRASACARRRSETRLYHPCAFRSSSRGSAVTPNARNGSARDAFAAARAGCGEREHAPRSARAAPSASSGRADQSRRPRTPRSGFAALERDAPRRSASRDAKRGRRRARGRIGAFDVFIMAEAVRDTAEFSSRSAFTTASIERGAPPPPRQRALARYRVTLPAVASVRRTTRDHRLSQPRSVRVRSACTTAAATAVARLAQARQRETRRRPDRTRGSSVEAVSRSAHAGTGCESALPSGASRSIRPASTAICTPSGSRARTRARASGARARVRHGSMTSIKEGPASSASEQRDRDSPRSTGYIEPRTA